MICVLAVRLIIELSIPVGMEQGGDHVIEFNERTIHPRRDGTSTPFPIKSRNPELSIPVGMEQK